MDSSKQSEIPLYTVSATDNSTTMREICQTPADAVSGSLATPHAKQEKQPLLGLSCKGIIFFLGLHVLFLALFSGAIIYTRMISNLDPKYRADPAIGFTRISSQMPRILYNLRADMVPNPSFLTSSKLVSVAVTLPAEYFALDPESAKKRDSRKTNTSANIDSAVHRVYNVDAVEVKEGSDPTALLWLSRDNHMLIIKPDKISLVSLPRFESVYSWVLSEYSSPSPSDALQSHLRGRYQVNSNEPNDPQLDSSRELLVPLPELVVGLSESNSYGSISVPSQIRMDPSKSETLQIDEYPMARISRPQFVQGLDISAGPVYMLPHIASYNSIPMGYPLPQYSTHIQEGGGGGIPQPLASMPQGPVSHAITSMPLLTQDATASSSTA